MNKLFILSYQIGKGTRHIVTGYTDISKAKREAKATATAWCLNQPLIWEKEASGEGDGVASVVARQANMTFRIHKRILNGVSDA